MTGSALVPVGLRTFGLVEVTDARGAGVSPVNRQPKRLALLAYLSSRHPSPVASREDLLALFWPEFDDNHARNALNKALHHLRSCLGAEVVKSRGRTHVGVDPHALACDARDFRGAVEGGEIARALSLYQGDFFRGLSVSGAAVLDEWVEGQRAWYRATALRVGLDRLAQDLDRGRIRAASEIATALDRIAPADEAVVAGAVRTLVAAGERERAVRRLERFEEWSRDVAGTGVSSELVKLLDAPPSPVGPAGAGRAAADPWPGIVEEIRDYLRPETAEDFRALLDHLPDMVHYCDVRGSLPFVNRELVEVTGYSAEEWRNMSYVDLVRPDHQSSVIEFYIRQLDERTPVTYLEFPIIARDGREIWIAQRVRLVEKDGEPIGSAGVVRDITSRVRREESLRRAATEDRDTRILNEPTFRQAVDQRIRFNRRSGAGSFITVGISLLAASDQATPLTLERGQHGALRLTRALQPIIRGADLFGRLGPMAFAILSADGGATGAASFLARIRGRIEDQQRDWLGEGWSLRAGASVHDPAPPTNVDGVLKATMRSAEEAPPHEDDTT